MIKRIFILLAVLMLPAALACSAEEVPVCEFDLDAYGENGGMLRFTYADGSIEETGGWGFSVEPDGEQTIGALLEKYDVSGIEAVCEGDVFEGWLTFEISIVPDEYGFDDFIYTPISDAPCTTEELLAYPLPDNYTVYAAKWAGIPAENYYQPIEEEEVFRMTAATLFANGGNMTLHAEDGDYESSMSVATVEPGQLLNEALELDKLVSVSREGYEFAGWTVYDVAQMETVEGEIGGGALPCFEVFDGWYTVLQDYTVLSENMSTGELGQLVCGETDFFIAANWK